MRFGTALAEICVFAGLCAHLSLFLINRMRFGTALLKTAFSPVFALTFRYFVQKYAFCRDCGSLQCEIFRITVNFWLVKSGEQRVLNRIKSVNLRR